MLHAVRDQRLSLMSKCDTLEAETEADLTKFAHVEAERAAADERVTALETALDEARQRRASLNQMRDSLRQTLEERAAQIASWRCLITKLLRTEAHLKGVQKACVVFMRDDDDDSAHRHEHLGATGAGHDGLLRVTGSPSFHATSRDQLLHTSHREEKTDRAASPSSLPICSSSHSLLSSDARRFHVPQPPPETQTRAGAVKSEDSMGCDGQAKRVAHVVHVVDACTLQVPSSGLRHVVDAVHPSPTVSVPAQPVLHRSTGAVARVDVCPRSPLRTVLFAVVCDAVEGMSCTVWVAGPSRAEAQHALLFGVNRLPPAVPTTGYPVRAHSGSAPSRAASTETGGLLADVIDDVLAVIRKERVQFRVRLSVAQLCPPDLFDAPAVDLLVGAAHPSVSRSNVEESFVSLFETPRVSVDSASGRVVLPESGTAGAGALVAAIPVTSSEQVNAVLAHAWRRRDSLLGPQQDAALFDMPGASVSSCQSCLGGGTVVLITVESVDVRGQFRRAAIRVVLSPGTTDQAHSRATEAWRRWSEEAKTCVATAVRQCAKKLPLNVNAAAWTGLGALGRCLSEMFEGDAKALFLCCCTGTADTAEARPDGGGGGAITVTTVSPLIDEWLSLAHSFCHAVHHAPSALEPFCVPEAVLQL